MNGIVEIKVFWAWKLLSFLDHIGSISGKKEKVSTLRYYLKTNEDFKTLIDYMLNPYIKFGILDFPVYTKTMEVTPAPTFQELCDLLDKLANRTLTGNAAANALGIMEVRGIGRELLIRILTKDPKAGFGEASVNEAVPGTLPKFPYMRCNLPKKVKLSAFPWGTGVYSQLKADGMFVNITKTATGEVRLSSRQGKDIPQTHLQGLVTEIHQHLKPGTQTHGELLVVDGKEILPRQIGNGILNSLSQSGKLEHAGQYVRCQVWDQIPESAVRSGGRHTTVYHDRFFELCLQINRANTDFLQPIESRVVNSLQEAYEHYYEKLAQGLEGIILKHPLGIWKDGTSNHQIKFKLEVVTDLKIVGFRPGKGKNESTFGAVIAQTRDGLLEVGVSGFTDQQRKDIWKEKEAVIGKVMAVEANALVRPSPSNNLYTLSLPRCKEIREDKFEADSLTEVEGQFNNAIQGAGR